jgi:hypothetical protein
MLIEDYENMVSGDATDIMTYEGEDDITDIDPDVLEALSGMDDDELVETTFEYPELMGRLFKRLRKRRAYRRKLRSKFRKMPRRKRRRLIRRMMIKRAALRLIPGSRLAKLIIMRRTSKAGKKRAAKRRVARRKRWATRRKKRTTRRSRRRGRPGKGSWRTTVAKAIAKRKEPVPASDYVEQDIELKKARKGRKVLDFPVPEEEFTPEQPKKGFTKFLPLVAAAAAIPFLLGNRKR